MADNIQLSSATRKNLLSLQNTTGLIGRTQERLATGLRVNSAIDDALSFFKARSLSSRANDLSTIKDSISNGISTIKAAVLGLETIENVLKQMKALTQSAIASPESATRAKLASQFNELRSQVDNLAEDAHFNGYNLLKNTSDPFAAGADRLVVKFNERIDSSSANELVVSGLNAADFTTILGASAVAHGSAGAATVWGQTGAAAIQAINAAVRAIDSALVTVRQTAQSFGANSAQLQIRIEFTSNLISTLRGGAAALVNADLNEESANLLSLQTRQELGTVSLSIAQQSEQSILRLF
jgi:flagellin-like hook-associated protein FlgL